MKSHSINELQPLNNETTINKMQDRNMNTEETTTLKIKAKLLKLEKKLLKHDFTKNKRFIDTILQLNF